MLARRMKLQQLIRVIPIQQRHQTSAASKNEISTTKAEDWEQSRPFNEIPKVEVSHLTENMGPGGKYSQMQFPAIILELRQQNGPLFRFPGLFGKSEFLFSHDPNHFERVLRAEGPWPERPGFTLVDYHRSQFRKDFYNGIEGIAVSQGENWANFRFKVNPVMMQPKTIRQYYQKMSNVNKEFIERIRDIRDSNSLEVPDTFEEEINRWTLESVSVVALDKQLGLINANRDNPQAKKLFNSLTEFFTVAADIELKPSTETFDESSPKFMKSMKMLDNIQEVTNGYINEAVERLEREPSNKPEDEQSVLEKLFKIDKKVAIVMAMDMLMAGVDTTTSTFVGALLCLAKNPEKQAKLREEVLRILPQKDSDFTEDSMKNVPYLRACIKEALRLYPLSPGNLRVIKSDIVLDGYQIPKETPVFMFSHGLLTDDEHFTKAKEFIPERYLRQTKEQAKDAQCPQEYKSTNPFVSLPFGFGSRMCIGKRIVEMELELGLARLIRNYHVEFNYPTENAFRCLFINVPNIPLKFKFTDVEN